MPRNLAIDSIFALPNLEVSAPVALALTSGAGKTRQGAKPRVRICERKKVGTGYDPGCVKTLRGIITPAILGSMAMRRATKPKNLSSARYYDQFRFRFHTTKTPSRHRRG